MPADAAMVILSPPKVVNVACFIPWIHYTWAKKLEATDAAGKWTISHNVSPLSIRFY